MDKLRRMRLKHEYEMVCRKYIKAFCKKQDMEFQYWIGDIVGGIAMCNDFAFDFADIVLDIDTDQPKGAIVDWHNDNMENHQSINYYSYTKGLRLPLQD